MTLSSLRVRKKKPLQGRWRAEKKLLKRRNIVVSRGRGSRERAGVTVLWGKGIHAPTELCTHFVPHFVEHRFSAFPRHRRIVPPCAPSAGPAKGVSVFRRGRCRLRRATTDDLMAQKTIRSSAVAAKTRRRRRDNASTRRWTHQRHSRKECISGEFADYVTLSDGTMKDVDCEPKNWITIKRIESYF